MESPNSLYKRGYALLACIIILFYVFLAKPLGCFIELLTNNLDCGQRCLHCFLDIVKILKIWTPKKNNYHSYPKNCTVWFLSVVTLLDAGEMANSVDPGQTSSSDLVCPVCSDLNVLIFRCLGFSCLSIQCECGLF